LGTDRSGDLLRFIHCGWVRRKVALDWLMQRRGADLDDVHAQAGPNREPRRVFLLGIWRTED
jgi:hypothetical protein